LTNSKTEIFSVNAGNAQSLCLVVVAVAGCSTHAGGPAALKLRSPKLLCVLGTKHVLAAAERIADCDQYTTLLHKKVFYRESLA